MKQFFGRLLFLALGFTAGCHPPPKRSTTYEFKEVGWTVTIPPGFEVIDSSGTKKMMGEGKAMIEKAAGKKLDMSSTRTLIMAKEPSGPSFNATITRIDPTHSGGYAAGYQAGKDLLYKALCKQMPNATIGSVSDVAKVGGLDFDRYHLIVSIDGKVIYDLIQLSKIYKTYYFVMNCLYNDPASKTEVEGILASCKFQ